MLRRPVNSASMGQQSGGSLVWSMGSAKLNVADTPARSLRRLPGPDGTIDLLGMLDLGHTQIMRDLKIEP